MEAPPDLKINTFHPLARKMMPDSSLPNSCKLRNKFENPQGERASNKASESQEMGNRYLTPATTLDTSRGFLPVRWSEQVHLNPVSINPTLREVFWGADALYGHARGRAGVPQTPLKGRGLSHSPLYPSPQDKATLKKYWVNGYWYGRA